MKTGDITKYGVIGLKGFIAGAVVGVLFWMLYSAVAAQVFNSMPPILYAAGVLIALPLWGYAVNKMFKWR